MTLIDRIKEIERKSKSVDLELQRSLIITESVFQKQDISFDYLELNRLRGESASVLEDGFHKIFTESSKHVQKILEKTRRSFHAYNEDINTTINEKIHNDKTELLYQKITERTKKDSSFASRKIEVHDTDREINILLEAVSELEKLMAKIKVARTIKEMNIDINDINSRCQKARKKVGKIEMGVNEIIKSLYTPTKINDSLLSYETDISKMAESESKEDQEKTKVYLQAYINLIKVAKEVKSVELHGMIERLKKLRAISSKSFVKESVENTVVTEAVVNDKKVAKIYSTVSSYIVMLKTYIKVAKSIQRSPELKGVSIGELKGFVKDCEKVISELRTNRQKLKDTVHKAKLGDASLSEKIFGDGEVRSMMNTMNQTFRSVSVLKKKMNKISRQNRKIIRNIKTVEVKESAFDELFK